MGIRIGRASSGKPTSRRCDQTGVCAGDDRTRPKACGRGFAVNGTDTKHAVGLPIVPAEIAGPPEVVPVGATRSWLGAAGGNAFLAMAIRAIHHSPGIVEPTLLCLTHPGQSLEP
jgi:hypothetical protein